MRKNFFKNRILFSSSWLLLLLTIDSSSSYAQPNITPNQSSQRLNESSISTAIKNYVLKVAKCEPWQAQIECKRLPAHLSSIKLTHPLHISCLKRGPLNGNSVFKVSYKNQSGKWNGFRITCHVRRFINVLVASHFLDRGYVIRGNEFRQEKREVTNLIQDVCPNLESALGKRTKRILSEGTILTTSMIEAIPVVRRGDSVTALIRKKNLILSFPAKVNQPGQVGDLITVRDVSNNRIIKAEVMNHETVVVKM
jgi:flagella basal body P-ring formation protein FlgA